MTERLIGISEVVAQTSLSRGTIYALMGVGRFPRPLQVAKRSVRWLESDIEKWLQARIAEREALTTI